MKKISLFQCGSWDYAPAYPEMQVGLVIDWNRDGEIGDLARRRDGRYFSQLF